VIYVVFYLVRAALLLALPIAWLAGAIFSARFARKHLRHSTSVSIAAVILASAPLVWVAYAWSQFKDACPDVKPLVQFKSVSQRQGSLLLRLSDVSQKMGKSLHMDIRSILNGMDPICIENEFWKPITDSQTGQTSKFDRQCGKDYFRSNEPFSSYAIEADAAADGTGLGYVISYRAVDLKDNSTIAEAQEKVFGRGLLMQYIGLFRGSNNPEYLACGYIKPIPYVWRSSRGGIGSPDYDAYVTADRALFRVAAGELNAR
jgi:hypothetical protein